MAKKTKSGGLVRSKRVAPRFRDLSVADRRRVAAVIVGSMKRLGFFERGERKSAKGRGGYKVVHGPDQLNREWSNAEHEGETGQLTASERNRLIAFARNAARNSHHLEGALHQLEINVAGVEGGKAVFNFPAGYEKAADKIKEAFADWAQEAEYFEDATLQMALRWVLRTQMIGGDMVLVFDWDVTKSDTGQIIGFEPDCIGNLSAADFRKVFPEGFTQTQGIVKNEDGKTVGVIVSWSQRGETEYRLADGEGRRMAWPLVKPVGQKWTDSPFIIYRETTRFNQVRGSSRLWPGLGTVKDLADAQGFELQSAKRGAQIIGQVTQPEEKAEDELAKELDPDATTPVNTDGDDYDAAIAAAQEAAEDGRVSLDLEEIDGAGAIYDVMPPGVKMELFDTKHPNDKLVEFSRWMHGSVAFALGLGDFIASGKAESSYSAAMAELMMSNVEFRDMFAKLRRGFLDWAFNQWSLRAQAKGIIPADDKLPPHWRRRCVEWQEPQRHAINPVDEQNALNMGLKNGTILYRDKLGPDWKSKVSAFVEEVEFFKAHGIPHPALQTVSGGVIETSGGAGENKGETDK